MKKIKLCLFLVFLCLLYGQGTGLAETMYVTDRLYLSLRNAPDPEQRPLALLPSDTKVDVLETKGDWAKVMLEDGRTGWVMKRYLTKKLHKSSIIEQLEEHAKRLGVRSIKHQYGADAAAVAFDAVRYAEARGINAVLIDTAGRMQTNLNLMREMEKIVRVIKPDLVLFIGDSLTGNDAVTQAQEFNKFVHISASILTKVDADAKGGAAISITHATKKPILFLGTGQRYEDVEPFKPEFLINRILGP